jgi:hypothetical protein
MSQGFREAQPGALTEINRSAGSWGMMQGARGGAGTGGQRDVTGGGQCDRDASGVSRYVQRDGLRAAGLEQVGTVGMESNGTQYGMK